jgi:hypothetical protein
MSEFDQKVKAAAEHAVLQFITSGGWLLPNYESRMKIPAEWLAECWRLVDADKLRAQIATRLEAELADRIVNRMAEELATDIKQILSVQERREALRSVVRDNLDKLTRA